MNGSKHNSILPGVEVDILEDFAASPISNITGRVASSPGASSGFFGYCKILEKILL
jgi:hypothetical protein